MLITSLPFAPVHFLRGARTLSAPSALLGIIGALILRGAFIAVGALMTAILGVRSLSFTLAAFMRPFLFIQDDR